MFKIWSLDFRLICVNLWVVKSLLNLFPGGTLPFKSVDGGYFGCHSGSFNFRYIVVNLFSIDVSFVFVSSVFFEKKYSSSHVQFLAPLTEFGTYPFLEVGDIAKQT